MKKSYSINIIDHDNKNRESIACQDGETLLNAMKRHGISCRSDCGGRGSCGKCRIKVIRGHLDVTPEDRKVLSASELEKGIRLACMARPAMDCDIRITFDNETYMDAVTTDVTGEDNEGIGPLCIGIDLGTTTLALALADLKTGKVVHACAKLNSQRQYGADIISRVNASNKGEREHLAKIIRQDIAAGIGMLLKEARIESGRVKAAAISGNTVMMHMLKGYSCEGLGKYPFTPVSLDSEIISLKDLLNCDSLHCDDLRFDDYDGCLPDSLNEIPVTLLPGISAFIGADIVSGLMACGYAQAEKPSLFIDLGTNGEMALGNRYKILAASTAAGPAFEGVNISCGTGSVPGAISSVEIRNGKISYGTINDMPPIGICGSGVCELVSELLDAGLIDRTGLLAEEYFKPGINITGTEGAEKGIYLTQKDIRQFQLAKAAVRTGIELLLEGYGIGYDRIDTVYLAGGFGFHLNAYKAANVGMLVPELAGKVKAVGNSSLAGALRYLTDKGAADVIEHIRSITEELYLSREEKFNDLFVRYMSF